MTRNDWIVALAAVIIYQIYVTVLLLRTDAFDEQTKMRQVIMIWLIPVVGALLVRIRLRALNNEPPR